MLRVPVSTRSPKTKGRTYKSITSANSELTPSIEVGAVNLCASNVPTTLQQDDTSGSQTYVERGEVRVHDVHAGSSITASIRSGSCSSVVADRSVISHRIASATHFRSLQLACSISSGQHSYRSARLSVSNQNQRSVPSVGQRGDSRVGASRRSAPVPSQKSFSLSTSSRSSTSHTQPVIIQ